MFFFGKNDEFVFSQIFSLLLRPNQQDPVMANLETRGKNYTNDRDLCVKDSCKFVERLFTNSLAYMLSKLI